MLLRFDPFGELDRLFEDVRHRRSSRPMPMDAYRRGDAFVVHFDLPGVDADSIDLTVDNDVLTIKATRTWAEEEGDEVVAQERPQGAFERRVYLSEALDREHVEARYENGVLTVRMPLVEAVKPRHVPVAVTAAGKPAKVKPEAPSTAA